MEFPKYFQDCVAHLSQFPGVGEKSATRFALFLTRLNRQEISQFSMAIDRMSFIKQCQVCGFFCDEKKCGICNNEFRLNSPQLCVVESVTDLIGIENSGHFKGSYFILGGVINPLLGIGPEDLKIEKLVQTINQLQKKEIILAINPSIEGDATCSFIKSLLNDQLAIERIGFGVPIGGNLEYLDPLTISKALDNRQRF